MENKKYITLKLLVPSTMTLDNIHSILQIGLNKGYAVSCPDGSEFYMVVDKANYVNVENGDDFVEITKDRK